MNDPDLHLLFQRDPLELPFVTKGDIMSVPSSARKVKRGHLRSVASLTVPDVSGLSDIEAAHEYLDAGLMPHPWRIGVKRDKRTKISCRKEFRFDEAAESHDDIDAWEPGWRCGLVTSRASGLIVIDIDDMPAFEDWDFEDFPPTAMAITGHRGGRHLLYDARELSAEDWPRQGNMPGGQIKSNGFVSVEPSRHPSGRMYRWGQRREVAPIGRLGRALAEYRLTVPPGQSLNGSSPSASRGEKLWTAMLAAKSGLQSPAIRDWIWDATDRGLSDDEILDILELAVMREQLRSFDRRDKWTRSGFSDLLVPPSKKRIANARSSELEGIGEPIVIGGDEIISADDIAAEKIDWLNEPFLPFGCLVIIDGDPAQGKSVLTLGMVARAASGRPVLPFGAGDDVGAIHCGLLGAEDDWSHAVVPRLQAAGYRNNQHVWFLGLKKDKKGHFQQITFPDGTERIRSFINKGSLRLLIIDPISAFIGEKIHTHNEASVRMALAPLAEIARDTGCCIVLVRHLNKDGSQNAMYRGTGSIAFNAIARSGILCGMCPDGSFGLAQVKASYSELFKGVVKYSLEKVDRSVAIEFGEVDETLTANNLLGGKPDRRGPEPDVQPKIRAVLEEMFGEKDTWSKTEVDLRLFAKDLTPNARTLAKVAESMGIRRSREYTREGKLRRWVWTSKKIRSSEK